MSNETAIIYHQIKPGINCPDGIASAWVAKRKYPEAKLIGCSYGDSVDVEDYKNLVIVDFSFPIAQLKEWESEGKTITVIDHHKTAMADLSQFTGAIFDMNESGATLTWKTFFPDETMPAFLAYVKDRDLWDFALPDTHEIHEATGYVGRTLANIDLYCSLDADKLRQLFTPLGEYLLAPKRALVAELAGRATRHAWLGYTVMALDMPTEHLRLVSDVCTAMYKSNNVDFVMTYNYNQEHKRLDLSFRSDKNGNDFDVSAIAKQCNGGGHRNAAGGWVETLRLK
jgi:uncharacterized protein